MNHNRTRRCAGHGLVPALAPSLAWIFGGVAVVLPYVHLAVIVLAISSASVCLLPILSVEALETESHHSVNSGFPGNVASWKDQRVAIVTLVTTSEYVPGAQVLVESLNRVNAAGDRILLWVSSDEDNRSDLNETHMKGLRDAGWNQTIPLTRKDKTFTSCEVSKEQKAQIAGSPEMAGLPRYWGTCSKFAIWSLTEYQAVIYLDADSLALHNFDFIFDILLGSYPPSENQQGTAPLSSPSPVLFAAQGNTDCWEEPPPYNQCANFYTALLAIKPSMEIARYFHNLASQPGTYLMYGELVLLNTIISSWYHLPRYTLVAQSETARPMKVDPQYPSIPRVDWSQVKVYDFSGPPATKPWKTYWLQKETGDKYLNSYLGRISPESRTFEINMHPQWVWNDCYDSVLKRLEELSAKSETHEETINEL